MRIAIVGNAGGGKTTVSRRLAAELDLPLHHVDTHQFTPELKIKPFAETIEILNRIQGQSDWIIDGFGPLDIIEKRFELADKIIFVDLPLWRHYFWSGKRLLKSIWSPRAELPKGSYEISLEHIRKLFETIDRIHHKMRPELLRILGREQFKRKLIHITKVNQLGVISLEH